MNFFLDMAISVILSTLKELVKNRKKKAGLRKAMLKVRDTIDAVYDGATDSS